MLVRNSRSQTVQWLATLAGVLSLGLLLSLSTLVAQADGVGACEPVRIMPLGDSITQGKGEITDDPSLMIGYRKPLYESLVAAGYAVEFVGSQRAGEAVSPAFDVDHEGHPGWTTAELSDSVYSFVAAHPPEVILLHIGTNDMGVGFDLEASTANVERILEEIDRYDRGIEVVLARIIDQRTPSAQVSDFNDSIAAMARQRIAAGDRIYVVDQQSALSYPADMADRFHPKQSGYDKMAAVWLNRLEAFVPPCGEPPTSTPTKSPTPGTGTYRSYLAIVIRGRGQ